MVQDGGRDGTVVIRPRDADRTGYSSRLGSVLPLHSPKATKVEDSIVSAVRGATGK